MNTHFSSSKLSVDSGVVS